jgi:uncharacterized RDD family membrane protein YckC
MQPPPPPEDDLEATVAMPRVAPLPPPPGPRKIADAVVERPEPPRPVPPRPMPVPPTPLDATRVSGTVVPRPTVTVVPPPRFDVGNPFGYICARFFAFAFDIALVACVVTSLAYSLIAINPITGLPTNSQRGFDATLAIGLAIALVYVWLAEAFFGTTIWKLAFGLHVFALHGRIVGLGRAFLRSLLRPVDLLIVGGVLALLPGHRRLGDLAAGTCVARSPLRGFAPLIGWILILVMCGIPFILAGTERTLASIVAFGEFAPGLFARVWLDLQSLLGLIGRPH